MIRATMNAKTIKAPEGCTILEAAANALVTIPTLCKHPDLEASGACGICMVRVAGRDDLVRACTTQLEEGMAITTHDPELIQLRRTALELILSTHPNECLSCGRNGTCELQKLAEEFSIRRESFAPLVANIPADTSTKAVVLEPRKCLKCRRCITVCQDKQNVWALSFLDRGIHTRIAPASGTNLEGSPCVRCGQCSAHCPVGAIIEHDDTQTVWEALADPDIYCIAQVAPAVRVSLGEVFGYPSGTNLTGQLYDALRMLGFDTVFDTTFGADVTIMEEASEFAKRLSEAPERLPLITTCCPSWVAYMEEFHSDLVDYFSSCKSPQAIVGTLAKTYYAEKIGIAPKAICVVSLMPCTAKKYEISRTEAMFASGYQDVDISITTRELIRMIQQHGIAFPELNCLAEPDSPLGEHSGAGLIFGATGGVMEAALRSAGYFLTGNELETLEFDEIRGIQGIKEMQTEIAGKTLRIAVAHGLANIESLLAKVKQALRDGTEPPYHFIEVMACPGGCVGGGGQAWHVDDEKRQKRADGLFREDSYKMVRCSHQNPFIKTLYDEFLGEPLSEKAQKLLHTKRS